ncbi:autotransporter outer membrane beta-barrel domain-containing protein [Enterobacter roggenkampii]|uniref:autotransporter outer membrane beta-barrel domain-containing protein n=1 Tax=Enterobacter roggenkampii TaxID=1812935 RepID=UPI00294A5F6D|nr:autotransporter outer membrane beta-barrel domain-containing protein [Enterobacter roggenkampii]MDV5329326.1 autotransporter outer membrane beta-barrel domain-containing protein [Enterobacter roggenkampii]
MTLRCLLNAWRFRSATDTTINIGGEQFIFDGGSATSIIINSGGSQVVSSGGEATSTTIYSRGEQVIFNGGSATSTTINDFGYQHVYSGGTATSTIVNEGGYQHISSGGAAISTTIISGSQVVSSGGSATATTFYAGGLGGQTVDGGSVTSTTLNDAAQLVINGGTATDTIINDSTQIISLGGTATSTTINGGVQYVENSGSAISTIISSGSQRVSREGTVTSTTVNSGGSQQISYSGSATSTDIYSGGEQLIFNGGSATSTTIFKGGKQHISSGGSATSTTINNGGNQYVSGGGTTTDTTINGGKSWLMTGAVANGETKLSTGGELLMDAGAIATNVNISGGTLSVNDLSAATSGQNTVQVGMLTMDGGNVNFLRNSDGEFAKLTITELNGTGNFLLNTSLADKAGNFVTIEQGSGQFGLAVNDSGKEISNHDDLTLNLIHEKGGDIDFEMVTASGRSTRFVDGGTYMYTLYSQQDKDGLTGGNVWYLGAMGSGGENPGGENPGGENPGGENPGGENPGGENPGSGDNGNAGGNGNGGKKPMTTPATDAILAMSNAGLNVVHSELDGLRTYRAGLDKTGPESNVWGHYLGSKSDIDTSNGAAYQLSQNGMEIGADTRTDFAGGSLVTGAFMSFSDNKVKHARGGTSKIDSYGLGLYATWFDASGFYADGVVKGNRLNNKLRAVMTNGGRTGGDWTQYALSTAVEGGYQFDLKDDVSITPYARLAFVQMTSEDVKLSNGMKGNTGTPRSVTGESGAKLSGKFSLGSTEFKPYLSAAVVQEFANSNEVTINERNRFDNNVKGTSGKYGLGASVNVGKDVTLYGEANYRQGSQIETPIQGVAGIRIGF